MECLTHLGDISLPVDTDYFLKNSLNMGSIATKTFILLLAQNKPLNFIQGTNISLENVLSQGNRKEFHHIFPKAYLKSLGDKYKDAQINCLANFSILSRSDNNKIKDQPPSKYLSEIPINNQELEKILVTHFCSTEMFNDDYDSFLNSRAKVLLERAKKLL